MDAEFIAILLASYGLAAVAVIAASRLPGRRWPAGRRLGDVIVGSTAVAFFVAYTTLAIMRHQALNSHAYDLAIFDQTIWNSAQGRLFQNSVMADSPNFLGHHLSPLLLALAPIYWLWPDPRALLVVQVACLAIAGLPIYWEARAKLPSAVATALGVGYFLAPASGYIALFDFHEVVLAMPLLSLALLCLQRRRYGWMTVLLAATLLAKEEMGIVVAAVGAYVAVTQRRRLGIGLLVGGVAWAWLAVTTVIPSFHETGQYFFNARFTQLGATQAEIVRTVVTRPLYTLGIALSYSKLQFVHHLVVPLAYLPLGSGLFAVAIPSLAYLLLQDHFGREMIQTQYSAPLLPLLGFATVIAAERVLRLASRRHWRGVEGGLAILLVASALASYGLHGPGPLARRFEPATYTQTAHTAVGHRLMAAIPPQAAVAAQSDLVPHLSRRPLAFMFPWTWGIANIDYILLDRRGNIYPFDDEDALDRIVGELQADPAWTTLADEDGYLLLRRGELASPSRTAAAAFSGGIRLLGYDIAPPVEDSTRRAPQPGDQLRLTLFWQATAAPLYDYTAFVHLVDADGRRWAVGDARPTGQAFGTSQWQPGSTYRGIHTLDLPPTIPPGRYTLVIGLYRLETMQRLPVVVDGRAADSVVLGEVVVGR